MAGFFALELLVRQPGAATSLRATENDRGTTRGIVRAFVLGVAAPVLLRRLPVRPLPRSAARLGLGMAAAGFLLRLWSMRMLGTAYSRTLRTGSDQTVVDAGAYRLVRHPGYLGTLLTWSGFSLTSRSAAVVAFVGALFGRAYARRIDAEEHLLSRDLPGYDAYRARTKRLIPFVW